MPDALYRRYRPETFADVIGQEHVTEPLSQALRKDHVHHAYLFSGPRGCGKTTSARILARCLNCEKGPTPTPCGECRSCLDLARGGAGSLDVIEIDAASHGGVDDARDLREKAFFSPASSRYKIYIVDEAHMVSPQGFNALLKVVEEPPEHLKFIFATTEPEKVIGTIRSRTHHYPFRLVPPSRLQEHLAGISEREQIPVAPGVLPLVVRAGRGSVRDALSVLDQLMAGAGDEGVTYALATALLGFTDDALLDAAIDAFAAADGAQVFTVVDRVIEGGLDPRRFAEDLLERLRDLVVLAAVPEAAGSLLSHCPEDRLERMRHQATRFGAAGLSRAADLVSAGLTEMRGTTTPRLQLELICARILLPAAEGGERSVATRLERVERLVSGGLPMPAPTVAPVESVAAASAVPVAAARPAAAAQPAAPARATAPAQPAESQQAAPADRTAELERPAAPEQPPAREQPEQPEQGEPSAAATGHDLGSVRGIWPVVLGTLATLKRTTWTLVSSQAAVAGVGDGVLTLAFPTPGLREQFAGRSDHGEFVRQALIDVLGVDWRVEAIVGGPTGAPAAGAGQPAPASRAAGQPAARTGERRPAAQAPSADGWSSQPGAPAAQPAPAQRAGGPGAQGGGGTGGRAADDRVPADDVPPPDEPPDELEGASLEPDGWDVPARATAVPSPAPSAASAPASPEGPAPSRREQALARVAAGAGQGRRGIVPPEQDQAEADDPDLDDSGLTGIALLERDLGARVIGEFDTT
ncbi:DNA polymerase-3 subunit gamma/tau [Motilibacter peucedani]|uniref:DNA polymerase III subunit gamma/tau n=1 Tax=Motilibacter peucedani TaxID=598650 RepID=A0A420XQ70_9ACTN|nr:DNA polymerase III subunit gamma and tau [Motilibacter peucedani]RKS75410.1 DNA polymerase-3 subunit gamma/tau [Motilibacter peucedani]